jgi:predicted nucleotidyltransferase
MRLHSHEIQAIEQAAVRVFPAGTVIYLFGSRLDDTARGGDIDLLVESPVALSAQDLVDKRTRFIAQLYLQLGEQRIDVAIAKAGEDDSRSVVKIARNQGRKIVQT